MRTLRDQIAAAQKWLSLLVFCFVLFVAAFAVLLAIAFLAFTTGGLPGMRYTQVALSA